MKRNFVSELMTAEIRELVTEYGHCRHQVDMQCNYSLLARFVCRVYTIEKL